VILNINKLPVLFSKEVEAEKKVEIVCGEVSNLLVACKSYVYNLTLSCEVKSIIRRINIIYL
jgi:hypothetical protein